MTAPRARSRRPWTGRRWVQRSRFTLVLAALLGALAMSGPVCALAQPASGTGARQLEAAARMYDEARWDEAIRALQALLQGDRSRTELRRAARELLARCYAKIQQPDSVYQQVRILLEDDANWTPDARVVPPEEIEALRDARERWLAEHAADRSYRRQHRSRWERAVFVSWSAGWVPFEPPAGLPDAGRARVRGFPGMGIIVERRLDRGRSWALESGIAYRVKGGENDWPAVWYRDSTGRAAVALVEQRTFRIDYLVVPLSLKRSWTAERMRRHLAAGMEAGLLLGAQSGAGETTDYRDYLSETDWAVRVAAALEWDRMRTPLILQVGYAHSLSNAYRFGAEYYRLWNRSLAIDLGLRF